MELKYPRTPHLPWSGSLTSDDIKLTNLDHFKGKELIYLEKLDGENTVMSRNSIHARSIDGGYNKPWQTYMKRKWAGISILIPENTFICGENLFAVHSIEYNYLLNYFFVFAVIQNGMVLSWIDTLRWSHRLYQHWVPIVHRSVGIEQMPIPLESVYGDTCEGYVVRNYHSFPLSEFAQNVAKCVRPNHVQTDEHWTRNWKQAKIFAGLGG